MKDNTPKETFKEANVRLTKHSADFVVDPKNPADMQLIKDLRSKFRKENSKISWKVSSNGSRHRFVKRLVTEWRLPKGTDLSLMDGYNGTSMPHFKQKDAVLGLVYIRTNVCDYRKPPKKESEPELVQTGAWEFQYT